jgi:hypothetical protein
MTLPTRKRQARLEEANQGVQTTCNACGHIWSSYQLKCARCGSHDARRAAHQEEIVDEYDTGPSPGVLSPPLPGQLKTPRLNSYGETNAPSMTHETISDVEIDNLISEAMDHNWPEPPGDPVIDNILAEMELEPDSHPIIDRIAEDC